MLTKLTKEEAFTLGIKHGLEMASSSGSNDPGCEGWAGMLINADPRFVEDYFGFRVDNEAEVNRLLAEYARGCQAGADVAIGKPDLERPATLPSLAIHYRDPVLEDLGKTAQFSDGVKWRTGVLYAIAAKHLTDFPYRRMTSEGKEWFSQCRVPIKGD